MNPSRPILVNGRDGRIGWVHPEEQPEGNTYTYIRLTGDQQSIQVPADLLIPQEDGTLYLPMSRDQFKQQLDEPLRRSEVVIPVLVERAEIAKHIVDRGKVLVHKRVQSREEVVEEPAFEERVDIEHIPINKIVDTAPQVRFEGETMIIPVVEEVLVVEKRLNLKAEVRVTKRREDVIRKQRVTLRAEEVDIERVDSPPAKQPTGEWTSQTPIENTHLSDV